MEGHGKVPFLAPIGVWDAVHMWVVGGASGLHSVKVGSDPSIVYENFSLHFLSRRVRNKHRIFFLKEKPCLLCLSKKKNVLFGGTA